MLTAVSTALRIAIPVIGILYISDIAVDTFGLLLWQEQVAMAMVGLTVADILLTTSIKGQNRRGTTERPPLFDAILSLAALGLCGYVAVTYETLIGGGYFADPVNIAIAVGLLGLVAEATRRNAGWPMIALLAVFFIYGLTAADFSGFLRSRSIPADELVTYLALDPGAMLGSALTVVVTTVLAFVLFGSAIFKLGGGDLFIGLALAVMGRFRGGSAKTAVVASSLFGSISGSAVANVVTTGIITIPLMKKSGYRPAEAGAIEAVASTGGQILPPIMGAAAFIMANNLGVPYSDVALAALVPALLFYACVFAQCHFRACRGGVRGLTEDERPDARAVLAAGWPFLLPLVVLIVLLFATTVPPIKAALYATAVTIVASFLRRDTRPGWRQLMAVLEDAGQGMLSIVPVVALAGMLIGVLSVTGLSFTLSFGIVEAAGGNLMVLLLLCALAAVVLGMGLPTTAVYIVLAGLVAPALIKAGLPPMAAHLYVFYYGALSMITPPVCLAAFAGASIAGAGYMSTGWEAVRIGLAAFLLPVLFALAPELLLLGDDTAAIVGTIALGGMACILLAGAVEGFLFTSLGAASRLMLAGLAVALGVAVVAPPDYAAPSAVVSAVVVALLLRALWRRRGRIGGSRAGLGVASRADATSV